MLCESLFGHIVQLCKHSKEKLMTIRRNNATSVSFNKVTHSNYTLSDRNCCAVSKRLVSETKIKLEKYYFNTYMLSFSKMDTSFFQNKVK